MLSQGEPRDAFWHQRKADEGEHIPPIVMLALSTKFLNKNINSHLKKVLNNVFRLYNTVSVTSKISIIFVNNFVYYFNYNVDCRYFKGNYHEKS